MGRHAIERAPRGREHRIELVGRGGMDLVRGKPQSEPRAGQQGKGVGLACRDLLFGKERPIATGRGINKAEKPFPIRRWQTADRLRTRPEGRAVLGADIDRWPAGQPSLLEYIGELLFVGTLEKEVVITQIKPFCLCRDREGEGRQGPRARTLLASPLTAAVAAVTGKVGDVRDFFGN